MAKLKSVLSYSLSRVGGVGFLFGSLFFLTACNANIQSLACSVTKNTNGSSTITCPDGSSTQVTNGQTGASGTTGLGAGIASSTIPVGDVRCLQGNGGIKYTTFIDENGTGILATNDVVTSTNYLCNGATGAAGVAGATGAAGVAGVAGTSSSISVAAASAQSCADGGWVVSVTNGGQAAGAYAVCDGAQGTPGQAGATGAQGAQGAQGPAGAAATSPLELVQMIAPCGVLSSAWKEELLLFSDGSLLADFSDNASGLNTRLSLIPDGTYVDTDNSGCVFSIQTSGSQRTLSWGAGSSSAEPSGWSAGGYQWSTPVAAQGATEFSGTL